VSQSVLSRKPDQSHKCVIAKYFDGVHKSVKSSKMHTPLSAFRLQANTPQSQKFAVDKIAFSIRSSRNVPPMLMSLPVCVDELQ